MKNQGKFNLFKAGYAFLFLTILILVIIGCSTVPVARNTVFAPESLTIPGPTAAPADNATEKFFAEYPVLQTIFEEHGINTFPGNIQDKFVTRYIKTLDAKYLPKGNTTFCTAYFYDYFNELGYDDLLERIKNTSGKTMVEKVINFEKEYGEIKLIWSGYEAQLLANQGREVGVIGEYYYDKAEKIYTRHYSVVQPSQIAYDDEGRLIPYYVTGLITRRNDVNDRYGTGPFLAQVGVANGLIDFRWAYNRKLDGIIQLDAEGNIRGGIVFIIFPEKQNRENLQVTLLDNSTR